MATYDPQTARLLSFHDARQRFADGGDTPRAYLERCIETIEAREPEVHAFAAIDLDAARRAADASAGRYRAGQGLSPVDGLPFGVKDLIETTDLPTAFGSKLFDGWHARRDAACVLALRRGGAIMVGKTVTTEFGAGASGPTRNPWDPARTPGGSSSGSAAAVGAGMLPVALGTQVVGSIIRPSGFCGVYGFKPSFGALNQGGIHSPAPSQAHLGVHAGTLEDCWAVCHQIAEVAGGDPGFTGLRGGPALPDPRRPRRLIRLETAGWQDVDAPSRAAFGDLVEGVAAAGVEIVAAADDPRVAAIEAELADAFDLTTAICCYEMRWPFGEYRERAAADVSGRTLAYIDKGYGMTRADYAHALERRAQQTRSLRALADDFDAFLMPSAVGPAPVGLENNGSRNFNALSSGLHAPSVSLPLLAVEGLPFGVQLMGYPDADASLAAYAGWLVDSFMTAEGAARIAGAF